jgi:hypothetical protein
VNPDLGTALFWIPMSDSRRSPTLARAARLGRAGPPDGWETELLCWHIAATDICWGAL